MSPRLRHELCLLPRELLRGVVRLAINQGRADLFLLIYVQTRTSPPYHYRDHRKAGLYVASGHSGGAWGAQGVCQTRPVLPYPPLGGATDGANAPQAARWTSMSTTLVVKSQLVRKGFKLFSIFWQSGSLFLLRS